MKQKWTVIGYFDDNGQIWCEHVECDKDDAIATGMRQVIKHDNEEMDLNDIAVVAVIEGHHMEVSDSEAVCYAVDVLAEEIEDDATQV